jgi:hypothetical protein
MDLQRVLGLVGESRRKILSCRKEAVNMSYLFFAGQIRKHFVS